MANDDLLVNLLNKLSETGNASVSLSKDLSHGDLSTSVALSTSSPRETAEKIIQDLNNNKDISANFLRIEMAGPGFINFFYNKNFLLENIASILKDTDKYGYSSVLSNNKIIVEYTDPNPFKEFHIGHLYSNIVGESLSRLFETQGAQVKRACYQGDVGLHVAKSVYGMIKSKPMLDEVKDKDLSEKAEFLGKCYVLGSKLYEEDEKTADEIREINKKIYQKDTEVYQLYQLGRDWSLQYFETIYKRLGTDFDLHYFESEVASEAINIVKKHLSIFVESEGAIVFPGENYGLHTRVFINKQCIPTYEAKDLALAPKKYKDFPYDQSIIITGNEVNSYFDVVMKALSLIDKKLSEKTKHIGHGMIKLQDRKISSRTGDIVTATEIIETAKAEALKLFKNMDTTLSENVALAAIKYVLLKNSIGGDLEFSFDKSITLSGNSGPYLQYTYARTQSVLRKHGKSLNYEKLLNNLEDDWNKEEDSLVRYLVRFQGVISSAQKNYSPSTLCTYLYELAQIFNSFYTVQKILGSSQEDFRLALTASTGQVIKNGLNILGIAAPDSM